MPLASILALEVLKSKVKEQRQEVDIIRDLLKDESDKLKSYNEYVKVGYSPRTCNDFVFTPKKSSKEFLPLIFVD